MNIHLHLVQSLRMHDLYFYTPQTFQQRDAKLGTGGNSQIFPAAIINRCSRSYGFRLSRWFIVNVDFVVSAPCGRVQCC